VRNAPDAYDVQVVTRNDDHGSPTLLPVESDIWTQRDGVRVRYVSMTDLKSLARAMAAVRGIRPELIYVNSFFNVKMSIIPQLLHRLGYFRSARLLVAPRGEFGTAALGLRSAKKELYLGVYRLLGLRRRVTWQASTKAEETDIERVWGPGASIIVRENDTLLPAVSDPRAIPTDDDVARPLSLVSVGRLVEHKGLHLVLEGLQNAEHPIELDVYGPEEDPLYVNRCTALVDLLPSHVTVRFHEPVPHENVREVIARYDALVMATAGENFGHVIAEALSVACPVLCSDTTPWSRVLAEGGGVVVPERTPVSWRDALSTYAALDRAGRILRRRRAGSAYDAWKAQTTGPHIFDLALKRPRD